MEPLLQSYNEKSTSNQQKINQGIQILRKRHIQESQKYMQQHHQRVQSRRLPEQMASAEWAQVPQRLRAKHQQQLQQAEIKELEKNTAEMTTAISDAESSLARSEKEEKDTEAKLQLVAKDVENKKRNLQNFRTKFGRYLSFGE
jgi:hypothetical protein